MTITPQPQQQQKKIIRAPMEVKPPNAENVTAFAIEFLKTLGNKRGIKPRKVSLQGQTYVVELDVGKDRAAVVRIEAQAREIKEYEITVKEKEESGFNLPLSPKTLVLVFGVSAAVYFIFELVNLSGILFGH